MKKITFLKDLYLYFKNRYRVKYIITATTLCIQDCCYRDKWDSKPGALSTWCVENCAGRWENLDDFTWAFSHDEDAVAFKMRWGMPLGV